MKPVKALTFLLLVFWIFSALPAQDGSWNSLKRIQFHDSQNQNARMLYHLDQLDVSGAGPYRCARIASILEAYGDHFNEKGNLSVAKSFYQHSLAVNPNSWQVFNKIDGIQRKQGKLILGVQLAIRQFFRITRNFSTSFLLVNRIVHAFPLAILITLLFFSLVLFLRYFKLIQKDLFFDEEWHVNWLRIGLVLLLITWPMLLGIGWGAAPFVLFGLLWVYLERNEKRTIITAMTLFLVAILFLSFQTIMDRRANSPEFMAISSVFHGEKTGEINAQELDEEMTVIQAFNDYESGHYEKALERLEATGAEYSDKLKFQLLGNIYYRFGNIPECIDNLRKALRIDDTDPVSLNNFTLTLLKNGNVELLESYSKRFPQIRRLKRQRLTLREPSPGQSVLWSRIFNPSNRSKSITAFLGEWGKGIFHYPGTWMIILFLTYILIIPRFLSKLGKSTSCSKCGKSINRAEIHRSYKLCGECYQLFMIKDVMFIEAKAIKEKELNRLKRKRKGLIFLGSLVVPGLNLLYSERSTLYLLFSSSVIFFLLLFLTARQTFLSVFGASPLFLSGIGVLAVLGYVLINLFSLRGEEDGF